RDMREHHDRRARTERFDVLAKPFQLLRADGAEAFQLGAVVQADEVHALVVKALPGLSARRLGEALEIEFGVVAGDVVLAGYIEQLFLAKALEDLIQRVKFAGLRQVGQIAGVKNEIRLVDSGVDLIDRQLQGSVNIYVGGLVEPDMAVTDLYKSEVRGFHLVFFLR